MKTFYLQEGFTDTDLHNNVIRAASFPEHRVFIDEIVHARAAVLKEIPATNWQAARRHIKF